MNAAPDDRFKNGEMCDAQCPHPTVFEQESVS